MLSLGLLSLLACSAGAASSPTADVAIAPPVASSDGKRTDLSAALDAIQPESEKLESSVAIVAASTDVAVRERAAAKLIEIAHDIESSAWDERAVPRLLKANRDAELDPGEKQLAAQIELYRAEEHARVIVLMDTLGGSAVIAHSLAVATTPKHASVLREAAVALLAHHAPDHAQLETLRAGLAAEKAARPSVGNAGAVVASMAKDFRRCWNIELSQPNAPREVKGKVTAKLGPDGRVISMTSAGFGSASLEACLEAVVKLGNFDAPARGGAAIVIPISFLPAR